jgi:SEC-C motif
VKYFRHAPTAPKQWYERDGGARLAADKKLLALHYPSLTFVVDDSEKRVKIVGSVCLNSECGVLNQVAVEIRLPRDYPSSEPVSYDAERLFCPAPGRVIEDRHICSNGQFCFWLPPKSPWSPDDPKALLTFLDELSVFLDRQLIYDVTGEWPGPHYDHGVHGYRQFIIEQLQGDVDLFLNLRPVFAGELSVGRNEICPCDSGKKFKKCHLDAVTAIERSMGIEKLKAACSA